jgi:hypothetical protein
MSIGGASLIPKSLKPKDVANSFASPIGSAPAQQLKNVVSGKGFVTDEKAKMNAQAEDAALAAIKPASTGSMTPGNQESLQAEQDLRRQALRNMGFLKTTYAGETGGFNKGGQQQVKGAGA